MLPLDDRFDADLPPETVIGSPASTGAVRQGRDDDGCLSIDRGALRITPPGEHVGWGHHVLCYGPFEPEPGLTLAVSVLNGHNASQTSDREVPQRSPAARLARSARLVAARGYRRLRPRPADALPVDIPPRLIAAHATARPMHENLAVGWYGSPDDPQPGSSAFVVHAVHGDNAELWAPGRPARSLFSGLRNNPVWYVVVQRPGSVLYLAASVAGSPHLGAQPQLRPLAVGPAVTGSVYGGVQQAILGEVGYRVDTRVDRVRIDRIPAWSAWYGSASVASRAPRSGERNECGEHGATWVDRPDGSIAIDPAPGDGVGLIAFRLEDVAGDPIVSARWRQGAEAGVELLLDGTRSILSVRRGDEVTVVAERGLEPGALTSGATVQILDDGRRIAVHLGADLIHEIVLDVGAAAGTGLGLSVGDTRVVDYEAHPRAVPLPPELAIEPAWEPRIGDEPVIEDDLALPAGELAGPWRRVLGAGTFEAEPEGTVKVRASPQKPNPGRTVYARTWAEPSFCAVEVEVVPPGSRQGEGHRCRGGLCLWEDEDTFLVVNIWNNDSYQGSSVSSFLRIDGREGFYDPVWTLTGDKVVPGRPVRLRVASDGELYRVWLDGEPVLYRSVFDVYPDGRRFAINQVGLVANWEWGDDTGSRFRSFRAYDGRGPDREPPPAGDR